MNYKILLSILCLFCIGHVYSHDIEQGCHATIIKVDEELHVSIQLPTGLIRNSALGMSPEFSFTEYLNKPFDSVVVNPLRNYLNKKFSIAVNSNQLVQYDFKVAWVEGTKSSDHSVIVLHVKYKLNGDENIRDVVIENSLLFNAMIDQTNTLIISVAEKSNTLSFTNVKEVQRAKGRTDV